MYTTLKSRIEIYERWKSEDVWMNLIHSLLTAKDSDKIIKVQITGT